MPDILQALMLLIFVFIGEAPENAVSIISRSDFDIGFIVLAVRGSCCGWPEFLIIGSVFQLCLHLTV